jgi:hypothetical protein
LLRGAIDWISALPGNIVTLHFTRHQEQVTAARHAGTIAPYRHQTRLWECQHSRFAFYFFNRVKHSGNVAGCDAISELTTWLEVAA